MSIAINTLECMETAVSIYKDVVETSHKKTTRENANCAGLSRLKRGESALSYNYSKTIESDGPVFKWPYLSLYLSTLVFEI